MENDYWVSAEWLKEHLGKEKIKVIETPWKPEGYLRAHIEGALCLPYHSYLKAEEPNGDRSLHVFNAKTFEYLLTTLGINEDDEIVVYDEFHALFATRFWWVCRYFGLTRVRVLNGGWQGWIESGYPISMGTPVIPQESSFAVAVQERYIISMEELKTELGLAEKRRFTLTN